MASPAPLSHGTKQSQIKSIAFSGTFYLYLEVFGEKFSINGLSTIFDHFEGLFWPYFESVNGYDFIDNGFGTP